MSDDIVWTHHVVAPECGSYYAAFIDGEYIVKIIKWYSTPVGKIMKFDYKDNIYVNFVEDWAKVNGLYKDGWIVTKLKKIKRNI